MARNINVEDIHFYVRCPSCGANIGVTGQQSHMLKNCYRCGRGEFTMDISVVHGNPQVKASFKYTDGHVVPVKAENITVG